MNRPRAADDFETIRARIEELRRERAASAADQDIRSARPSLGRGQSEAERRRRHVQVALHRQTGETHIDAVNVRKKIAEDSKRQKTQVNLAHRRLFNRLAHDFLPA